LSRIALICCHLISSLLIDSSTPQLEQEPVRLEAEEFKMSELCRFELCRFELLFNAQEQAMIVEESWSSNFGFCFPRTDNSDIPSGKVQRFKGSTMQVMVVYKHC
jgi:hypothetical protein